eukprot:12546355-Ditylum_brightwellii.AAC.1
MIINIHRKAELYAAKLKPILAKGSMDFLNEGSKRQGRECGLSHVPSDTCDNFYGKVLKIGYLGIKRVLDNNKVNCMTFTTIQASDLKETLETMKLKKDKVTYYTHNLPKEDKKTIDTYLEMIKFGMQSTLIQYQGKYYAYKRVVKGRMMEAEDIALAIGACESAFCTDIVASYFFKMTEISFLQLKQRRIYSDNGLVIFMGKWTRMQVACWLIWSPTEPSTGKISNNNGNERQTCSLMKKWMKRGFLCFGVYHKEGQAIKLTSKTVENGQKLLDKIYSKYIEALLAADLEPIEFLTLDKIWEKEALSKICMRQSTLQQSKNLLCD